MLKRNRLHGDFPSSYKITDYTRRKAQEIGVDVQPSTRRYKKLDVFKKGQKIASIGDVRYLDYPQYKERFGKDVADERRRLYHARHKGVTQSEQLARHLLW
jgi:hypothetical protein